MDLLGWEENYPGRSSHTRDILFTKTLKQSGRVATNFVLFMIMSLTKEVYYVFIIAPFASLIDNVKPDGRDGKPC